MRGTHVVKWFVSGDLVGRRTLNVT
jgi:hypothetical protein